MAASTCGERLLDWVVEIRMSGHAGRLNQTGAACLPVSSLCCAPHKCEEFHEPHVRDTQHSKAMTAAEATARPRAPNPGAAMPFDLTARRAGRTCLGLRKFRQVPNAEHERSWSETAPRMHLPSAGTALVQRGAAPCRRAAPMRQNQWAKGRPQLQPNTRTLPCPLNSGQLRTAHRGRSVH
jgi:hypothetical protein